MSGSEGVKSRAGLRRTMSYDESLLPPAASAYLDRLLPPPFPVMMRVEAEVRAEKQPAIGRQTGSTLRALALARGAERILEVGTNVGYSGLWLASGLARGGRFEGIELDDKLADRATANLREAIGARATVHRGAALEVLPRLPTQSYDLVFLDAVKAEYPKYLDHALRLARPGGVICADNLFQRGAIWAGGHDDESVSGMREFTRRIFHDARLVSTIVPVEDGLSVSTVRG